MKKTIKVTFSDNTTCEITTDETNKTVVSEIRKSNMEYCYRIYNTLFEGVKMILKHWYDDNAIHTKTVKKVEYITGDEVIDTLNASDDKSIVVSWCVQNSAFKGEQAVYSLQQNDKEQISFHLIDKE